MINNTYLETYLRVINNISRTISLTDFLNDVYFIGEHYIDQDTPDIQFSKDDAYTRYYIKIIENSLINNQKGNIIKLINFINSCETDSYNNLYSSDDFIRTIMNANYILDKEGATFISRLFKYCRLNYSEMVKSLKGKLLWAILNFDEIEKFIVNLDKKSINIEPIFANKVIAELSNSQLVIPFILNDKNLNELFDYGELNKQWKIGIFKLCAKTFNIRENYENVLFARTEYYNHPILTLKEAGYLAIPSPITRERARQIDNSCTNKLSQIKSVDRIVTDYYYSIKTRNSLPYLSDKEFYKNGKQGKNETSIKYVFAFIQKNSLSRIKYDPIYRIIYDSDICSVEDLIKDIDDCKSLTVLEKTYNKSEHLKRMCLDTKYKRNKVGNYVRKGTNNLDIIREALKKHFKKGYHAQQLQENNDYLKLIEILNKEYGLDTSLYSPRSIAANIERMDNFVAIGRGVYIENRNPITFSNSLLSRINDYLEQNSPVVRYQAVYEEFKKEFNLLGIKNRYHLKSALDPYISYDSGRDDITVSGTDSFKDVVIKDIKKCNTIFSNSDLMKKYPGNGSYVFDFILSQLDDLLLFENKTYLNASCVDVTDKLRTQLKSEIDEMLNIQDSGFITSRKLYSKLKIVGSNILTDLPVINSQYRLFSLIQYLFKDEYCLRRPIIGRDLDNISKMSMINDYLNTLDKFNNKDVKEYVNKMGLGNLYSYLDLMINISDDFIQINSNTMINKRIFNINESFLQKMTEAIDYYINSFGEIDTRTYKGYSTLPKITWDWNKYLLIGIIRTYLGDEFEIKYTDVMYNKTDFIIRRYKNER